MKNIVNNKEILNKIENNDMYEYIKLVEKKDKQDKNSLEFIRNSLDFSFGLNISAMCVEDILNCLEEKEIKLLVAKTKDSVNSFYYYLLNKEDVILFDGKKLDARELYVILYTHISSKIMNKEEYCESAYTESICQIMQLGYTLTFGRDKYTVLTDNENEVFFAVNLSDCNMSKIRLAKSESFYSEGFRDFEGIIIEDATDTFDIVNLLCQKHKDEVCYIEDTTKIYGETESEFFKSIQN